ncbi:MAG TPA: hypothetical protein VF479_07070, partial [Pseudolysinimonas sp.]
RSTRFAPGAFMADVIGPRPFATIAETRAFINGLIDLWDRDRARPFSMKREFASGTGPMIWALANHTVILARAVLLVTNSQPLIVAVPQIRLMIDGALTAAWLTVQPNALGAMMHEHARQRKTTISGIIAGGTNRMTDADLAIALSEMAQFAQYKLPSAQNMEQRFKAMAGGADLYSTYRIASMYAHASADLADIYLEEVPVSDEAPLGVALAPDNDLDKADAWLGTAGAMVVLAMSAVNVVDSDGRFKTQLEKARRKLGVEMPIKLANSPSA